jgi:abortive infection bacteriophage resistance protein
VKNYTKTFKSYSEQVSLLASHGLTIHNENYAQSCLKNYNYYRLSAYWYIFRQKDVNHKVTNQFVPDRSFEDVIRLYEFDNELRLLLLKWILKIEVSLRTQVAYNLAQINNNPFSIYDSSIFFRKFNHSDLIEKLEEEVKRSIDYDFINHFRRNYHEYPQLPIWALTEVMSFGRLQNLIYGLLNNHRQGITDSLNISTSRVPLFTIQNTYLPSYIDLLVKYRNICAHNGRVWNRKVTSLDNSEANVLRINSQYKDGIFSLIIVISRFLQSFGQADEWKSEIKNTIQRFPNHIDIHTYSLLPKDWSEHPLLQ